MATGSICLKVPATPVAPTIQDDTLDAGYVNAIYSFQMQAIGGAVPFSWGAVTLPAGLSVSSTGLVTGTPTLESTGSATFTVTGSDAASSQKVIPWTILPDPVPTPTPPSIFSADETLVTVGGKTFRRPVISPWAYTPSGATYWVSPDGNDGNTGTESQPWQSIVKGLSVAMPGDCVYLKAGTYTEQVVPPRSGTPSNQIILSCAPGALGLVTVQLSQALVGANTPVVNIAGNKSYLTINGLIIRGYMGEPWAPVADHYGQNGVTLANGSGLGIVLTNLVATNNLHCGIKEMGHGGTGFTIEACVCYGNGVTSLDHGIYCPASDAIIYGNICHANIGYGIHAYSTPANLTITYNLCCWNGQVGTGASGIIQGGSNSLIAHNTIWRNASNGFFYFRAGCMGNTVRDNIAARNGSNSDCGYDSGGAMQSYPAGNTDDYNDYFPGRVNNALLPLNTIGSHELNADPLFVDPDNGDFRLQAGSPCLGTASDGGNRGAF